MTLAKRIIPTLLVRGRTLVKGKQFAGDRSIGHVLQAARVHAVRGVDELCILDIGATAEGRGPDLDMVSELVEGCFIPVTVGGGIKTMQDIRDLMLAGADKVCIGAAAIEDQDFLRAAADLFGSQAITVSVDAKPFHIGWIAWGRCGTMAYQKEHEGGWKELSAAMTVAREAAAAGAGEILLQSIDRDGMMTGYDLELIREVANAVSVPVIASGGCSGYPDMLAAIKAGADAVAAGALYAFTDNTPKGAAKFLAANGVPVRL